MDYCYEDFYEPSEYDQMIEEFKDELRKSVKKEWIDRMNRLEEENKELQEIKKNYKAIKNDYENKKFLCEQEKNRAIADARKDARRERLSQLLSDVQLDYWRVTTKRIQKPKCNKCNENRQIEYITPSGRKATEYCTCRDGEVRFVPKQMTMYEIKLHNTYNDKLGIWFVKKHKDDDVFFNSTEYFGDKEIIDEDIDINEISTDNKYDLFFKSIEKCQEYCDLLNEQKGNE